MSAQETAGIEIDRGPGRRVGSPARRRGGGRAGGADAGAAAACALGPGGADGRHRECQHDHQDAGTEEGPHLVGIMPPGGSGHPAPGPPGGGPPGPPGNRLAMLRCARVSGAQWGPVFRRLAGGHRSRVRRSRRRRRRAGEPGPRPIAPPTRFPVRLGEDLAPLRGAAAPDGRAPAPAFFVQVFNSDETFLATQAEVINEGGRLYEDATDRKPPLVPYLYAATFSVFATSALWSVRVIAMLAVALTALLLALEARRRYGDRAGWLAGILFVLASVAFAPQDGQAANFEVFMLPGDDRGGPAWARAGARAPSGCRGRGRDAGEADGRGDAAPRALPRLAGRAGSAASATRRSGSRSRSRSWRCSSGPGSCCSGRCSATARTSGSARRRRTCSGCSR